MNFAQLSPRIVTGWRQLEQESADHTPRFKCGHPKTPDNTRRAKSATCKSGRQQRCLTCHREANRMRYVR